MNPPTDAATLPLRDIHGPSAFGSDWRRLLQLTWLMSKTEFKLDFEGSRLGLLWVIGNPLLYFGVIYVVFVEFLHSGFTDVKDIAVLLLFNIMMFQAFAQTTGNAVRSLVARESVVRKTQFPRIAIPLAVVAASCLGFGISLLISFSFMLIYGIQPMWTWLLLPVIVIPFLMFMLGMSMLLSSLYVFYRDVSQIWPALVRALFYASCVMFTIEKVPEAFRYFIVLNPIAAMLVQSRRWFIDPSAPGLLSVTHGWVGLLGPIAVFVTLCGLGFWNFVRTAPRVAEQL